MSVTRNVIVDLLPACAAGEAHADSLKLVEEWATRDAGILLLGLAMFPVIGITRWYTVKLQDRIIQLEMQVRCARVLPAGDDDLLAQLSPRQVVALRFASDDELGDLLVRAVREQMTPTAIKQAVKQWRPDYMRT